MNAFEFQCHDEQTGVIYEPWTNGWAIGYRVRFPEGPDEFIYLNPSNNDSEGVPNVFLYHGSHGDPALDEAFYHYTL